MTTYTRTFSEITSILYFRCSARDGISYDLLQVQTVGRLTISRIVKEVYDAVWINIHPAFIREPYTSTWVNAVK